MAWSTRRLRQSKHGCGAPKSIIYRPREGIASLLLDRVEGAPGRWSFMTGHEHGLILCTSLPAVSSGWANL